MSSISLPKIAAKMMATSEQKLPSSPMPTVLATTRGAMSRAKGIDPDTAQAFELAADVHGRQLAALRAPTRPVITSAVKSGPNSRNTV